MFSAYDYRLCSRQGLRAAMSALATLDQLADEAPSGSLGPAIHALQNAIAHLRAMTHGAPRDDAARHPHFALRGLTFARTAVEQTLTQNAHVFP